MAKNRRVRFIYLFIFLISVKRVKALNSYAFNHRSLAEMAAATSVHVVTIIEPIIQHADWFFPEGKNYNIKMLTPKKKHLNSLSKN